ncbi:hypothetical protein IWX80_001156 [Flavobacterium sp. CAN_S2]
MNTEKKQWIAPEAIEIEVNSGNPTSIREGISYQTMS